MRGKPITKVMRVCELAESGKSIYHERWGRAIPAAFIQNMQTRIVVGFIRRHWLYEYKPVAKSK